jgi:hypothetical protein
MDGSAFEGHKAGQGFNFSDVNILSISGSTLGGEFVGLVLATVGWNDLDAVVI